MGGRNNYFYMPEGMASPFTLRRAEVPNGALTSHHVETRWLRDEHEREIYLYRPAVKEAVPAMHVHAFSPLEVSQGAATLGLPVATFLEKLQRAGLGSLPGTARSEEHTV